MLIIAIIGTIASVSAIPLAIFFYLRNRENKVIKARKEISKIVLGTLIDSKELHINLVKSIINSKIREYKLRKNSITLEEVLEDTAAEAYSNPLVYSYRELLYPGLRKILAENLIDDYSNIIKLERPEFINKELDSLTESALNDPLIDEIITGSQNEITKKKRNFVLGKYNIQSGFFGILSIIFALIAIIYSIYEFVLKNSPANYFVDGIPIYAVIFIISIVATLLTFLISFLLNLFHRLRENRIRRLYEKFNTIDEDIPK